MKKIFVCFFVAALGAAGWAPNARALGAYGVWWMPDRSDDDGFGVGIKDVRNISPLVTLDGRVSYVKFGTPEAGVIPVEATGLVKLGLWYGGVGVGYYFFTGDAALENDLGWYFLLGLEVAPGPVSVFGEVKWQTLEPDIDAPGGGRADLDALAIHVGVSWKTSSRR